MTHINLSTTSILFCLVILSVPFLAQNDLLLIENSFKSDSHAFENGTKRQLTVYKKTLQVGCFFVIDRDRVNIPITSVLGGSMTRVKDRLQSQNMNIQSPNVAPQKAYEKVCNYEIRKREKSKTIEHAASYI